MTGPAPGAVEAPPPALGHGRGEPWQGGPPVRPSPRAEPTAEAPARTRFADRAVLTKDEVFDLCDLLARAHGVLGARGWWALAGMTERWITVLEGALVVDTASVDARGR